MFHKVKNVSALPDFKLSVQFCEGVMKIYDIKPLFKKIPVFSYFIENEKDFFCVTVDVGGYGIVWNDKLDLSCDELWEHGVQVSTPFDGLMYFNEAINFQKEMLYKLINTYSPKRISLIKIDGLMSFTEATQLWNLNESTLRKAVSYGKLVYGVDVCKFGKQWVVSVSAMKREYGEADITKVS